MYAQKPQPGYPPQYGYGQQQQPPAYGYGQQGGYPPQQQGGYNPQPIYPQQQQQYPMQPQYAQPVYNPGVAVVQTGAVIGGAIAAAVMAPYYLPPLAGLQPPNNWTSSLCDMCRDMNSCCEVIWCCYCQLGYQDRKMSTGYSGPDWGTCCMYMCLDMWLTFGFAFAFGACQIRDRVRHRFNIEPMDGCMNGMIGFCCPQCSLCQTYRELSARGYWPMGVCVSQAPPTTHPMGAPAILGMGVR
jgi:Cys-rich protein (TIGR01571 family)